jgi:GxxExxY protein
VEEVNRVSGQVVDAAYHLHVEIGPGLLESVYERVLAAELQRRGLSVRTQVPVSFEYGIRFERAFRADMVVEGSVLVEVKSRLELAPAHYKQLLTYIRLLDLRLGLLLNFGAPLMKDGIHRVINSHGSRPAPLRHD